MELVVQINFNFKIVIKLQLPVPISMRFFCYANPDPYLWYYEVSLEGRCYEKTVLIAGPYRHLPHYRRCGRNWTPPIQHRRTWQLEQGNPGSWLYFPFTCSYVCRE